MLASQQLTSKTILIDNGTELMQRWAWILKPPIIYVCVARPCSWKDGPEDLLQVLQWARDNGEQARQIAANGQRLALE